MDSKVKKSLIATIKTYADLVSEDDTVLYDHLEKIFDSEVDFLHKVQLLDETFDDFPKFENLREYIFDLLMINFFSEDVKKLEEDYLESREWEDIEEKTIDRGSELLNLLLYLQECEDEEIEPSLDDYLKEFLLVDEDEFQDEYKIYESVISNQIVSESNFGEIATAAKKIDKDEEIQPLFYPLMSFFYERNPDDKEFDQYLTYSVDKSLDGALYQSIINFK